MRILILLVVLLMSCTDNDNFKDRISKYSVVKNNSKIVDTLTVGVNSYFFSDKLETRFKYRNKDSIFEFSRESDYTSNSGEVSIKPPVGGYLNSTEYLPYPELMLPPAVGDSIFSEHDIPETLQLNDNSTSGYNKVIGQVDYRNSFINEKVWVIESVNLNRPNYKAKYYFSPNYGFVYLEYNIGKNNVKIEIFSTDISTDE